jgi:hypothetical protein
LERPVRIRHSAVRILSAQPATGVSPQGFPVFGEAPIFPQVRGDGPGLWRGNCGISDRRANFSGRVSAPRIFNIRNWTEVWPRDRLCFDGDRFESAIVPVFQDRRCSSFTNGREDERRLRLRRCDAYFTPPARESKCPAEAWSHAYQSEPCNCRSAAHPSTSCRVVPSRSVP